MSLVDFSRTLQSDVYAVLGVYCSYAAYCSCSFQIVEGRCGNADVGEESEREGWRGGEEREREEGKEGQGGMGPRAVIFSNKKGLIGLFHYSLSYSL